MCAPSGAPEFKLRQPSFIKQSKGEFNTIRRRTADNHDHRKSCRTVLDKKDDLQQEKFFVYHELLTEFDEEFRDCLMDMSDDIRKKQGCMFISSLAKSCEIEAAVKAKNRFSLSYEVGCEKENAREICLQLISHDVAIFARSF